MGASRSMVDWRDEGMVVALSILRGYHRDKLGQRIKQLGLDTSRSFVGIKRSQDLQRKVIKGLSNFAWYFIKVELQFLS